jgi:hypothetical protein
VTHPHPPLGNSFASLGEVATAATRQQRFWAAGMWPVCAASEYEADVLGLRSLPLLGALPVAVLALAGVGGNASPQGGGGYGY